MNILYICDEYPPGLNGGIGTAVQLLSREMIKRGHNVYVIGLYSHYYGQADYEIDQGVHVYRKRYGLKLSKNNASKLNKIQNRLPSFIQKILYGKKDCKKFINYIHLFIKEKKIEIIEISDWNTFTHFMGYEFEWPKFNIPYVVKSHGSYTKIMNDIKQKGKRQFLNIDKKLYENAINIIAVSQDSANITEMLFKTKGSIKVIHNGVEIVQLDTKVKRKENKVLFFGSLMASKGIYSLIKAWNIVNKIKPDSKLYIYGKGKTEELKKLLNENSKKTVNFMGHVDRFIINNELKTSTVAVFPSYSETFGLTVIESMNFGCPVIYTKRSCGPEIITDKITGILVDPDDINEISTKILLLLNNNKLREQISSNAKSDVKKRFDINKVANEHINYYKEIINQFRI